MNSPRLPIFFVHVPKCAGSSVISLLRSMFEEHQICPQQPPNGVWEGWRVDDMPGYRLYAGHFYADFMNGVDGTKLIMLRHPISRVVSTYDFYRAHRWAWIRSKEPPYPHGPAIAKSGDLTHFLNTDNRYLFEQLYNPIARQLLGSRFNALMPDEDAAIAKSVLALRDYDWVGITELFDPSIRALCRTLGLPQPASVPRENLTYDRSMDDQILEPVLKTEPTEEERRRILQGNRIDLALHEEGRRILGERTERSPSILERLRTNLKFSGFRTRK